MLDHIGKDGISSLMVAGDISMIYQIKKTQVPGTAEYVQDRSFRACGCIPPLTGFLENEGHIMTVDGKVRRLKKILPGQGNSKTITAVISLLAREMKAEGYFGPRPTTLWKELDGIIKSKETEALNETGKMYPLKQLPQEKINLPYEKQYYHYRYRGNRLAELIPDLETVIRWPS